MDVFTKRKRSAVMAGIRGTGNRSTELRFAAMLRAAGITGWRRGTRVFGRPDFVFWKNRVAVFVDGCFWHGCPRHHRAPSTHTAFWRAKIARNRGRDRQVSARLRRDGWTVLRIWEHALRRSSHGRTLACVRRALGRGRPR